jgi:hypothetical protein
MSKSMNSSQRKSFVIYPDADPSLRPTIGRRTILVTGGAVFIADDPDIEAYFHHFAMAARLRYGIRRMLDG